MLTEKWIARYPVIRGGRQTEMADETYSAPTSPIYRGIGGALMSYGLLKEPPRSIAVGAGVLLLVVKLTELFLDPVARQESGGVREADDSSQEPL